MPGNFFAQFRPRKKPRLRLRGSLEKSLAEVSFGKGIISQKRKRGKHDEGIYPLF